MKQAAINRRAVMLGTVSLHRGDSRDALVRGAIPLLSAFSATASAGAKRPSRHDEAVRRRNDVRHIGVALRQCVVSQVAARVDKSLKDRGRAAQSIVGLVVIISGAGLAL